MMKFLAILMIFLFACEKSPQHKKSVVDEPFIQEYHVPYTIGDNRATNDVRSILLDQRNNIWAATRAGLYFMNQMDGKWIELMNDKNQGPVFDLAIDAQGVVYIAAWNGIYRSKPIGIEKIDTVNDPIAALCIANNSIYAFGPDGMWQKENGQWKKSSPPYSKEFKSAIPDPAGNLWIATGVGLYHHRADGSTLYQNDDDLISPYITDVAYSVNGDLWVSSLGGISVLRNGKKIDQYTPEEGLPTIEVQTIKQGPDGRMWVGTTLGVTRFDGVNWSLRHSRRWLLSDDVRDIDFDSEGNAWVATSAGVSAIKQREMTMVKKAKYFQRILEKRHIREPGLVEKCLLPIPGDTSQYLPRDDDNDGQYTSMYLAMESFRYAVTKSPQAKSNAKRAFEALHFLREVTETDGFVARTVIPVSWTHMADANRKFTDQEWAKRRIDNPREKRVEQRWRISKDGKWRWKGDTSSDEMTGHMYGYFFYYELVANDTEKMRVRDHVCHIVDYLIEGGFNLIDLDGNHTKWGVWSPGKLNDDPDWRTERGINSLEILSFLKLAHHVSGDDTYLKEYNKLLYEHDYLTNINQVKTTNPAWRTHIDDELLALAFPVLMEYEKDPGLIRTYNNSFEQWYKAAGQDCSPYFNFLYGAYRGYDPNLDCSIENLRDTPLDLVQWRVDNTKREDLELTRLPEYEFIQTNRLVPISERGGVMRWDRNPWQAIQGNGGHTESDGVFWLLPYWMGRYYGFITEPQ